MINFFTEGNEEVSVIEDYHSHNTARLDVEGMKKLLMRLRFIQEFWTVALRQGQEIQPEQFPFLINKFFVFNENISDRLLMVCCHRVLFGQLKNIRDGEVARRYGDSTACAVYEYDIDSTQEELSDIVVIVTSYSIWQE